MDLYLQYVNNYMYGCQFCEDIMTLYIKYVYKSCAF